MLLNDNLKRFLYLTFKKQIVEEYMHYEEFLTFIAFLEYFGLESSLGIFSIELYPDFIYAFHNWHKRVNIKSYSFKCC